MKKFERIILLILDACGIGELQDAAAYGDSGANTIVNTARQVGGLNLPYLSRLGLGNIAAIEGVADTTEPQAYYGKMGELSAGKDSTVGHWELAGLIMDKPFPVFPHGFPSDLMDKFEKLSGYGTIGNKPASGTAIIAELGQEHLDTGKLIVYTSADSVFQIAAHTDRVPLEKLYKTCEIARAMLTGDWGVSRVIARPFEGTPGNFVRTADRRDYSIIPPQETILDKLKNNNLNVTAIGKIEDLFAHRGLSESYHTRTNEAGIDQTIASLRDNKPGLIFINLVDFDMLWGHRNDYRGFAQGLEYFDLRLPGILELISSEDLLIITADHGCDPTLENSTDHTREYVPLLVYSPALRQMDSLGVRRSFADVAQTIARNFDLEPMPDGTEFLSLLK